MESVKLHKIEALFLFDNSILIQVKYSQTIAWLLGFEINSVCVHCLFTKLSSVVNVQKCNKVHFSLKKNF